MGNILCQEAHPSAATQNETPTTTVEKKVPVAELLSGESSDSPGSDASDNEHDVEAAAVTPPRAIPLETTDIPAVPSTTGAAETIEATSMREETEGKAAATEEEEDNIEEEEEGKKGIVLHTAPLDPRFPTANAARHCYTAYNEYYKCKQQKEDGDQECASYARIYRSICPDEWIERWNELRENGTWFGKY